MLTPRCGFGPAGPGYCHRFRGHQGASITPRPFGPPPTCTGGGGVVSPAGPMDRRGARRLAAGWAASPSIYVPGGTRDHSFLTSRTASRLLSLRGSVHVGPVAQVPSTVCGTPTCSGSPPVRPHGALVGGSCTAAAWLKWAWLAPLYRGGSSLRCRTLLWVAVHVLHSLVSESQSRCERTCRGMSPATTAIEHAVANSANKKIR